MLVDIDLYGEGTCRDEITYFDLEQLAILTVAEIEDIMQQFNVEDAAKVINAMSRQRYN